jgi:hypothetical protein
MRPIVPDGEEVAPQGREVRVTVDISRHSLLATLYLVKSL